MASASRVGVERLAEQRHGGRGGRGGEGDEQLVQVVLADDLGDLLFVVLLRGPRRRVRPSLRNGRRMAAPIWPSCERWASSIRNATRSFFSSGFFSISSSTQANFCCVVTMIGFPLLEEARQVLGLPRQPHHVLEVREVLDVLPDVRVERFAVREDEHHVHQLLVRAGLVTGCAGGRPASRWTASCRCRRNGRSDTFCRCRPWRQIAPRCPPPPAAPGGFGDSAGRW